MVRPKEFKVYVAEMIITLFGHAFRLMFDIRCPKCQNRYTWRKTRCEQKHSKKPARYQCSNYKKQFYAHTSALFREIRVDEETGKEIEVIDRFDLFKDLFTTNKTLKTLTEQYGISTSRLSELKTWFLEKVKDKLDELQKAYGEKLPVNEDTVMIYLDGMVIRVQNTAFVLILAVDKELNILGFEFAMKEEASVVDRVFKRALKIKGLDIKEFQNGDNETPRLIVVSDGHGCYRKMLRQNWLNCIHLVHVHKGDAQGLIIRLLSYQGDHEFETTMGTAINVFKSSGTSQIRVNTVKRKKLGLKGKRGRPRGSKNKPKPVTLPEEQPTKPKKRGPRNAWKDGKSYFFQVDVERRELEYYQPFKFSETLEYIANLFYGECITSNPVEIVNSLLRRLFCFTGPWTLERAELSLLAYMFLKKGVIDRSWLIDQSCPEQYFTGMSGLEITPLEPLIITGSI